jgi:hypothetical protein
MPLQDWCRYANSRLVDECAILLTASRVFGLAQFFILFARPMWVKLAVALAFVAPAAIAGFTPPTGLSNI